MYGRKVTERIFQLVSLIQFSQFIVENVNNFMFCRHFEVAYFLVNSTHLRIIFHVQGELMRLINLKLSLICDIFTFGRSISRHAFDLKCVTWRSSILTPSDSNNHPLELKNNIKRSKQNSRSIYFSSHVESSADVYDTSRLTFPKSKFRTWHVLIWFHCILLCVTSLFLIFSSTWHRSIWSLDMDDLIHLASENEFLGYIFDPVLSAIKRVVATIPSYILDSFLKIKKSMSWAFWWSSLSSWGWSVARDSVSRSVCSSYWMSAQNSRSLSSIPCSRA